MYVLSRNMKISQFFLSVNIQFLEVKFSIYLNRCVFVMTKRVYSKRKESDPIWEQILFF